MRGKVLKLLLIVIGSFAVLIGTLAAYAHVEYGWPDVGRDDRWSIGIYEAKSPLTLLSRPDWANPVLTAHDVTDVQADFVADPFVLKQGDTWFLFFEVFNRKTWQGDIAVATSPDGLHWMYQRVVLDEPFHLSYPYVFTYQNEIYMIPETADAHAIRLYKAVRFPDHWTFVKNLIAGDYVDPSILHYDNHWWLFAANYKKNDSLLLFEADNLTGAWRPHPKSPVIRGKMNAARPGGRLFQYHGKIFRYAQDDWFIYGNKLHAFEITKLTINHYQEKACPGDPVLHRSGTGWNRNGMHTANLFQLGDGTWAAAVDGYGK